MDTNTEQPTQAVVLPEEPVHLTDLQKQSRVSAIFTVIFSGKPSSFSLVDNVSIRCIMFTQRQKLGGQGIQWDCCTHIFCFLLSQSGLGCESRVDSSTSNLDNSHTPTLQPHMHTPVSHKQPC